MSSGSSMASCMVRLLATPLLYPTSPLPASGQRGNSAPPGLQGRHRFPGVPVGFVRRVPVRTPRPNNNIRRVTTWEPRVCWTFADEAHLGSAAPLCGTAFFAIASHLPGCRRRKYKAVASLPHSRARTFGPRKAVQRPTVHPPGPHQPTPQVPQVIGNDGQPKPHFVRSEPMATGAASPSPPACPPRSSPRRPPRSRAYCRNALPPGCPPSGWSR